MTKSTITQSVITMDRLATLLSPRVGRFVRDMTELTGYFDLDLKWIPEVTLGSPIERGPAFAAALRDQLGLKLEPSSDSVDLLVIDHINRPSTN